MNRFISAISIVLLIALSAYALWATDRLSDGRWLGILGIIWLLLLLAVWPVTPRPADPQDRAMVNGAIVFATIFAVLGIQLIRVQVLRRTAIAEKVGRDPATGEILGNPRIVNDDLEILRGSVLDRNGEIIAESVKNTGPVRRLYPDEQTAYVAGYFSPLLYGRTGLEATFDDELSGREGANPVSDTLDDLLNRNHRGFDLHLTLDADLQRFASDQLAGRTGAVVVLDVQSGAVRALVSNPHFDPSQLFTANSDDRTSATAYWQQLNDNPDRPLVLRATSGLVPPGSTFKTVTASAAIDAGTSSPQTRTIPTPAFLRSTGTPSSKTTGPMSRSTPGRSATVSPIPSTSSSLKSGLELGAEKLEDYAHRFGFGSSLDFDIPISQSQVASSDDFLDNRAALADTAFGQGQLLVTPLQMAVVAATIANDGELMRPYLVDRVARSNGKTIRQIEPDSIRRVMSTNAAGQVRDMMTNAVTNGSVTGAALGDFAVGGKTGTAEVEGNEPHSWFIGFVGDPEPRYAIAVLLEHGGTAVGIPVEIGRQVLNQAMILGG